jgi:hypothetical protein
VRARCQLSQTGEANPRSRLTVLARQVYRTIRFLNRAIVERILMSSAPPNYTVQAKNLLRAFGTFDRGRSNRSALRVCGLAFD